MNLCGNTPWTGPACDTRPHTDRHSPEKTHVSHAFRNAYVHTFLTHVLTPPTLPGPSAGGGSLLLQLWRGIRPALCAIWPRSRHPHHHVQGVWVGNKCGLCSQAIDVRPLLSSLRISIELHPFVLLPPGEMLPGQRHHSQGRAPRGQDGSVPRGVEGVWGSVTRYLHKAIRSCCPFFPLYFHQVCSQLSESVFSQFVYKTLPSR